MSFDIEAMSFFPDKDDDYWTIGISPTKMVIQDKHLNSGIWGWNIHGSWPLEIPSGYLT